MPAEAWDRTRLFLASFLALFLELTFIRFIPAYVRVVGFYTNVVLIASFFGLGLGFLLAERRVRLEQWLAPLMLLTVVLVRVFRTVPVSLASNADEPLWLPEPGPGLAWPIWAVVLVHYVAVAITLIPVGQLMGRLFGRFPKLQAYGLDLGGSLAGVVGFGCLSALETSPVVWFSCSLLLLIILGRGVRDRAIAVVVGAAILTSVVTMKGENEIWSPYYRVNVLDKDPRAQTILVNGNLHQIMLDFDADHEYITKTYERFTIPYRLAPSLDDVLIVGAGSGNDIAVAERLGAKHVDAVEIDRVFPRIGAARHHQHPYANNNVTLFIDDARAYFKRTNRRYDLIIFGTLDSQALLSGLSSVRLDNYVYTQESFNEAYKLLKPGGVLGVYHMSQNPYISGRIRLMLTNAAGRSPLTYFYPDHTLFNWVFVQGDTLPIQTTPKPVEDFLRDLRIPTDNWPFLFLREARIPSHYIAVLIPMLLLAPLGIGVCIGRQFRGIDVPLFLLGAGFLLLETKGVTTMSLLFGSTWVVNLLVFSSILAIMLAANYFVLLQERKGRAPHIGIVFVLLLLLLVGLSVVHTSWVAGQSTVMRWVLGGTMVALPIGLAGLIFPTLFSRSTNTQVAFASNLFGAVVGGIAENFSMRFGISALGLIAAGFYAVAFVWHRGRTRSR